MLLAIEQGNTNTLFAVHDGSEWVAQWRTATHANRTADEYAVWLSQLLAMRGLAIVMISQITEAMAVIPISTEPTWTVRDTYDRTRKIRDRFYEVRREQLRPLTDLVEWLQAREK